MERPVGVELFMDGYAVTSENNCAQIRAYIESLERDAAQLKAAKAIAAEQAEDEALWCIAVSIVEGHFQQELRRLTAAVEGDAAIAQQRGEGA